MRLDLSLTAVVRLTARDGPGPPAPVVLVAAVGLLRGLADAVRAARCDSRPGPSSEAGLAPVIEIRGRVA